MKFGIGLIIFFVSLVALVAEFVIYLVLGVGVALGGGGASTPALAGFFVWLMVMTGVTGILAPVCGLIEQISDRKNIGIYIMLPLLGLAAVSVGGLLMMGHSIRNDLAQSQGTVAQNVPGSVPNDDAFKNLTPEQKRKQLADGYLRLIQSENPHLNFIQTKFTKVKGGSALWAVHSLFSKYSFDTGSDARAVSQW